MTYSEPVGDEWKYDPEYNRVAEYLGVDRFDREDLQVAQKIAYVRDFLDLDGKRTSTAEVLQSLSAIKKSLGTNTQGKTLIDELFQHARLAVDIRRDNAVKPKPAPVEKQKVQKIEKKIEKPVGEEPFSIKNLVKETIQGVLAAQTKEPHVDSSSRQYAE